MLILRSTFFFLISLFTLSCTPLRILSKSSLRDSGTCGRLLDDVLLSDGACVVVIEGISPSPDIGGGGGGGGGIPAAGGGGGGGCEKNYIFKYNLLNYRTLWNEGRGSVYMSTNINFRCSSYYKLFMTTTRILVPTWRSKSANRLLISINCNIRLNLS